MQTRILWTLMALAPLFAACEGRKPPPAAAPQSPAGAAAGTPAAPKLRRTPIPTGAFGYKADGAEGTLDIKALDVGVYSVSIRVVAQDCAGQILGSATRVGDDLLAFVSTPEEGAPATCRADITFKDGKPRVQEVEGCSFYHGFSCSFSSAPE